MALTVNTNIPALNAQRNLNRTQNSLAQALKRLSSGLRINSAKDDAAGLAISSRMTSQIRGLNQAVRNANDGISLAQTAEGAMQEMTGLLQRMRELAVQAANDTNSAADRASIQNEVDQLYAELDRIADTSQFNSVQLLDGTGGSHTFQIGAYSGETISFEISGVTTQKLALNSYTGLGELNGGRTLAGSFAIAEGDVLINGFKLFGTGPETFTATKGAQEIAQAINDNTGLHSVTASAYNVLKGNAGVDGVTLVTLTINGDVVTKAGSMQELVDNINRDVSGVIATLNADGSLSLSNDTGDDIVVANATGTGLTAGTYTGYVSLTSADGEAIQLALDADQSTSTVIDLQNLGFNLSTGSSLAAGGSVGTPLSESVALTEAMDIQINGVEIGKSAGNSASDKADAVNAVIDETGIRATGFTELTVDFNIVSIGAQGSNSFIEINGTTVALGSASQSIASLEDVITAINASGIQGVGASADEEGNVILTSNTGVNINIVDSGVDLLGNVTDQSGNVITDVDVSAAGNTFFGRISLESETGVDVIVAGDDVAELGFTEQGGNEEAIGRGLSVNNVANASAAIDAIDIAIAKVSGVRGQLGSIQTRFESTIANLTSVSENVSAARSRIVDADFALETAAFTKAQIMQQAGIAMLAQANMLPQTVLSLLQ
jgi:flagellin